jgi:hypothetical protein
MYAGVWLMLLASTALGQRPPLKVLLVYDMEGISGATSFEYASSFFPVRYAEGRRNRTDDVNAAISGLLAGGATEIVVVDGHGSGNSSGPDILEDYLLAPARVLYRSTPFDVYMESYDSSFAAVIAIGMHAGAGNEAGFLSHTLLGEPVDFRVNGMPFNESMLLAIGAARVKIPLIMVSGDDQLEGKALYVAQANTIAPGDTARNVHFESLTAFDAVMNTFDRSGIRYGYRYYRDDTHGSVPLIAEYDALRFIFEDFAPPLNQILEDPSFLDRHYQAVSETLGATFEPPDGLFRLLMNTAQQMDPAKAIVFAELRVARFPDHPRPYEGLGDLWAARGDAEKARGSYEQALARNGYEPRIRRKIDRLGADER